MKKITRAVVAVIGCISTPAFAQHMIRIPYFRALRTADVCGNSSSYCQPTSSLRFDRVRGADYSGDPAEWLGRTYATVFQRSACFAALAPGDWRVSNRNSLTGIRDEARTANLRSKINADLSRYLGPVFSVLPDKLRASFAADATDRLVQSGGGNVDLVYERIDLTVAAIDRLKSACYSQTRNRLKIITGISVVTVSGTWTRHNLVDSFGKLEGSADFLGLSTETKAEYTNKKALTLQGNFEPLSFVIATAWRRRD